MPPQTRSVSKTSPRRSTRNSLYGRPPPSPAKPQKSATTMGDPGFEDKATPTVSGTKGIPWLACRDANGVLTSIAVSETGEGVHIRWYYPDDDCEVDEDEEGQVHMDVDGERGVTPPPTAGPSNGVRRAFPQTPMPLHPFDAGSVIRTPVKRAKPLQPSPPRIGDKGIRCLYEEGGVLRELDGGARVVLRHPVGSAANLTREQVERLEDAREQQIFLVQVKRLMEQKRRSEEEEAQFSDSDYEDEIEEEDIEAEGTNETIVISRNESFNIAPAASIEDIEHALGFSRGPNGELLDKNGQRMLSREGTGVIDSTCGSPRRIRREKAIVISADHFRELRRAHLRGPHGTEIAD